jgi:PilZ domain-containing protein
MRWGRGASAATQPVPERRRWARLSLAVPVFVRGINGQGKEFLEFCTLLNESAGGALLAIHKPLRRRSRVSLEIPSAPVLKNRKFRRTICTLRARVIRITPINGWNLCGLQFARPLVS